MTHRRTALLLISVAWVCHGVTIPGAPGGEWASIFYGVYWTAILALIYRLARWVEPGHVGA